MNMLQSKKFRASLAGIIVATVNQYTTLDIPEDTINQVIALVAAYVVGQGIADHGKERAKIEKGT